MREFISHDELMRVLEILGFDGDVLSLSIGPRNEIFAGPNSSWMLKVTCPRRRTSDDEPYRVEVVYIPVMLPADEERRRELVQERERLIAQHVHRAPVRNVTLPDEPSGSTGQKYEEEKS